MEAIKLIPVIVLSLIISGLVVTAGVKVLGNFRQSTCDGAYDSQAGICYSCAGDAYGNTTGYNSSRARCYFLNGTHYSYTNLASAEYNATSQTLTGTTEISNQFGTIGIIAAMIVILMMIGGLTVYFGLR